MISQLSSACATGNICQRCLKHCLCISEYETGRIRPWNVSGLYQILEMAYQISVSFQALMLNVSRFQMIETYKPVFQPHKMTKKNIENLRKHNHTHPKRDHHKLKIKPLGPPLSTLILNTIWVLFVVERSWHQEVLCLRIWDSLVHCWSRSWCLIRVWGCSRVSNFHSWILIVWYSFQNLHIFINVSLHCTILDSMNLVNSDYDLQW